jgi:catalase
MKKYILLFAFVITPVDAGIYKWTDSDGNVHFGDQPVNTDAATELHMQTNNKTGVTNSSGNTKEREYLLKKISEDKETDAEERKKKLAKDKERRKLCDRYRSQLQVHNQSNSIFKMSPDGERTYLTDKQRDDQQKRLSKGVAKYCR